MRESLNHPNEDKSLVLLCTTSVNYGPPGTEQEEHEEHDST